MEAKPAVVSSLILTVLLFCFGCEPEPQTTAPEPVQQATAEQVEPQQPTQQEVGQAEAETEMMIEQQAEQAAPQQQAEAVVVEPEPAEPMPAEPNTLAVPEQRQPSPDDVIVTVNGTEITRGRVDELVEPNLERLEERARGRKLPDDYLANAKKQITRQVTEGLIFETLIDQQMKKHNVIVTEQQIEDYVAQMAAREDMSVDDLKTLVAAGGKTYEQWKQQMKFDKIIGVLRLAQMEGFGSIDVNQAHALEFYEQNRASYEQPEQVRASHILIRPVTSDPNLDPNAVDAAAYAKAQKLLEQIKRGADFARLAMENSACPSSADGGDLGFGRRESWVKPFSDAAFALQPGQVSDIVKTRFGYHIIKVTERKEAGLTPFDQLKDEIIRMLQARREAELRSKYIRSLRDEAEIVYAEGQEPESNVYDNP
jgi:peptidyl-prolyl cis-trans isomerase C